MIYLFRKAFIAIKTLVYVIHFMIININIDGPPNLYEYMRGGISQASDISSLPF